jgi:CRP-like cAMP-binding protein/Fe-S-cluster-containing hydrogenase component 2
MTDPPRDHSGGLPPRPADHRVIPLTADAQHMALDRLREFPFFNRLSDVVLRKLQPHVAERRFAPGEFLLRLGAYSDAAYVIAEGAVDVVLPAISPHTGSSGPAPTPRPSLQSRVRALLSRHPLEAAVHQRSVPDHTDVVAGGTRPGVETRIRLGAGEMFGELGALSRYPVTADVVAAEPVLALMIRTPALRLMLKQRELVDFKAFVDERYRNRSLATHLRNVELFQMVDEELIEQLRTRAELLSFDPGEVIVPQGSDSDALYLVRGGYVKVAVASGDRTRAIAYLRKGDYAGEVTLLTGEPWPVTLSALEHVEVVRIARADFDVVVARHPSVRDALHQAMTTRRQQIDAVTRDPLSSEHLQMAMDSGLINGQSVLLIDLNSCTGCDDCVRACADTHQGTPRFVRHGDIYQHWNIPVACYQCSDPVCMIGCPTGAITRPLGTIEVVIDAATCIGCGNCVERCPWGNIITVPSYNQSLGRSMELATKCDLCAGRAAGPACVQMCPHGSSIRISFKDFDSVVRTLST